MSSLWYVSQIKKVTVDGNPVAISRIIHKKKQNQTCSNKYILIGIIETNTCIQAEALESSQREIKQWNKH